MYKFLVLFILCSQVGLAQLKENTFEQIDGSSEKKPIVVFIHTDWCKRCLIMKNTTLKDKALIEELNKNYHFVSFNAESKKAIQFKNKTYKFKQINKSKGIHELAELLGKYKHHISYPTIVFLNSKKEIVFHYTQRLRAKGFLRLLNDLKEHKKI